MSTFQATIGSRSVFCGAPAGSKSGSAWCCLFVMGAMTQMITVFRRNPLTAPLSQPALAPPGVPVGRVPLCRRSWPSQAAHTAIIASVYLMSLTNGACSCPLLGIFGVAGAMHKNEQYRGHERVLFGEEDGCVGTVDDFSSSLSEV